MQLFGVDCLLISINDGLQWTLQALSLACETGRDTLVFRGLLSTTGFTGLFWLYLARKERSVLRHPSSVVSKARADS